jgi:hypothetical protein
MPIESIFNFFCCGASGAEIRKCLGFYQGMDLPDGHLDWICSPHQYMASWQWNHLQKEMIVKFVYVHQNILKEVKIQKK